MPKSPEIIEGLFRESSIVTVAAAMNTGKSPLLQDWAVCCSAGIPWCGRVCLQRPVLMVDFESWDWAATASIENIARRYDVEVPNLPITRLIDRNTEPTPPNSYTELNKVKKMHQGDKFRWMAAKLQAEPNLVVMLDPIQLFFPLDYNNGPLVTQLFEQIHVLQSTFPGLTIISTFNLRKEDPRGNPPSLYENPVRWLQEASGSLNIQNRSDVRLGLAPLDLKERHPLVLNGLRRSEEMEPIVIQPVREDWGWAGFEPAPIKDRPIEELLTPKMYAAWVSLDSDFTLVDLEHNLPRATAFRMKSRCLAQGLISEGPPGVFHKERCEGV